MPDDPKESVFPAIPTPQMNLPSMFATVVALTEVVRILTAHIGTGQNAAVLRKDL